MSTGFGPTADLVILGELRLTLASPAQLRAAIARDEEIIRAVRRDGEVLYPPAEERHRQPGAELLAALGLR